MLHQNTGSFNVGPVVNGVVEWESSDEDVSTVDGAVMQNPAGFSSTGVVTAVGLGTATITATAGGATATYAVEVTTESIQDGVLILVS